MTTKSNKMGVPLCAVPEMAPRKFESPVSPVRERLIRTLEKKWVNGTVLHYHFLQNRPDQQSAVRAAFAHWKEVGIGLEFQEVEQASEAELRITFNQGEKDGSWSYIGRDAIDFVQDPTEATINYGWDLTTPYGRDTALHEIGHAIGLNHEHQNPLAGIEWNEDAVLREFSGPPNNWDQQQIRHNILRKLRLAEHDGSPWDRNSIMHYQFDAGLISKPEEFRDSPLIPAPGLSTTDVETVRRFYPLIDEELPELRPFESRQITIAPGQQLNYAIRPKESRRYQMQTFGEMDTVMVLFENVDGSPRYLSGDDDSGSSLNASITHRLLASREYILRLRLYGSRTSGGGALMLF